MKKLQLSNKDIALICAAVAVLAIAVVALIAVPMIDGGISIGGKKEQKTTYPARTTKIATSAPDESTDSFFGEETKLVTSVYTDRYGNTSVQSSVEKNTATHAFTSGGNQSITQEQSPNPSSPGEEEVLSWSTEQIVSALSDAVNKTKAYSSPCSVRHSESFVSDVTECTGGALVERIANVLVGYVVKPSEETLSYSGGYATNNEGENVPILLPKRGPFTLTSSGVTSASATKSGDNIHITVKIVPESVGMYDIPPYNAAGIGYLDVASLDLNFFTVTGADINYIGSSINVIINSDGMVSKATYTIPMHIVGSAEAAIAGGSATFDGYQTEVWELPW